MYASILLVDADPSALGIMAGALSGHFPVATARDPEDALRLLKNRGPFAAIVSDVYAGAEANEDFLTAVEELAPGIVQIAVTENPGREPILRALRENQISDVCRKPIHPNALVRKVQAALLSRPAKREAQTDPGQIVTQEERTFLLG